MFYSLQGTLLRADQSFAAVECGGVGFRCSITLSTYRALPKAGERVMLYTHLVVKEDALDLYGFATEQEKDCFRLLTSVSGVGPKVALAILSDLTPDQLALSIASGDSKAITRANGVGPKLAQRLVLELKDKITGSTAVSSGKEAELQSISAAAEHEPVAEACAALVTLGYSQTEAMQALGRLDPALPLEDLVRGALKLLSR